METPTRIPNSTILRLIAKGYLSSQLAQELHISKAAVFKRIKHLVKLEYIHTEKKGIIKQISLTAKGLAELNSVGVTQDAQPSPQKYTLKNIYENLRGYSEPHMRTAECLIFGEGTWWVLKSIFPDLKARYPEITIKYKEVMQ